jgi:hypothetical protein
VAKIDELDDNFVLQAAGEMPIPEVTGGSGSGSGSAEGGADEEEEDHNVYGDDIEEFDFDAHVARLMAAAEGKTTGDGAMWDVDDEDELEGESEDYDEDDEEGEDEGEDDEEEGAPRRRRPTRRAGAVAADTELEAEPLQKIGRGARATDQQLLAMLAKYDEEGLEEGDRADPRLHQDGWRAVRKNNEEMDDEDDDDDDEEYEEEDDEDEDSEDEEDADGAEDRRVLSSKRVLEAAMDEFLRERREGHLDAELERGMEDERGHKSRRKQPREEDLDDEDEESAEDFKTARKKRAAAAAEGGAPTSSGGFAVKIGLFKPAERPPSPVSSAAAAAVQDLMVSGVSRAGNTLEEGKGEGEGYQYDEGEDEDEAAIMAMIGPPKPKARWDAETIISTYTNTENHPRALEGGNLKLKVKAPVATKPTPAAAPAPAAAAAATAAEPSPAPQPEMRPVIRLSKKTGLPIISMRPVRPQESEAVATVAEDENEDEDEEDGNASAADKVGSARPKGETAEAKRERKAAIKAQRRVRREAKTALKRVFKEEEIKVAAIARHRDALLMNSSSL